jgi:hypothetical protein
MATDVVVIRMKSNRDRVNDFEANTTVVAGFQVVSSRSICQSRNRRLFCVYVQRRCTLLLLVLASVVGHTDRRLSSKVNKVRQLPCQERE